MGSPPDGEMTLVFSLAAIEQLADPPAVVSDARRWSVHLGVATGESRERLAASLEAAGIEPDVVSGEGELGGSLAAIRQRFPTERHVFVGTDDADREIAQALGWEYRSVREAAEAADWAVAADSAGTEDEAD